MLSSNSAPVNLQESDTGAVLLVDEVEEEVIQKKQADSEVELAGL
jgi:hypothetical protein